MDASRLKRAILPASLLLVLFLLIWACVPAPITDLRLVSLSRLPASALPRTSDLRDVLSKRGDTVWKVSLVGAADWIGQVKRHELNSYATLVRCDRRDYGVFGLGPYVGEVPVTYYGVGFKDYEPPSRTIEYDVYLPETGRYISQTDPNAPMPTYDLGKGRTQLCLRIAGGSMIGAYTRSNEVNVEFGERR